VLQSRMTIWHMCIVCWIPTAINTHTGCVLFAFSLHHWLYECTSMLRYIYIACLVNSPSLYRNLRIIKKKFWVPTICNTVYGSNNKLHNMCPKVTCNLVKNCWFPGEFIVFSYNCCSLIFFTLQSTRMSWCYIQNTTENLF
jgi:hypothetical protein